MAEALTEWMPYYGSSLAAPNVDEWGRPLSVIMVGEAARRRRIRELEQAQREMELQDMARQFAARRALQEDVAAGVPFAEAFRRRAPELTSDLRILTKLASEPDVRPEELRTLRDELADVRRQRQSLLGKIAPGPEDEQRIAELAGREAAIMGRIAERTEGAQSQMLPETAVPDLTRQPPDGLNALQEQWNAMAQPGTQLLLGRMPPPAAEPAQGAPSAPAPPAEPARDAASAPPPPAEPAQDTQSEVERIKQQYKAGQLTRAEAERALKALGFQ